MRPLLRRDLEAKFPALPVGELLWPKKSVDVEPERNLVFKFASLAAVVSASTASDDTSAFKEIAAARNALAHGSARDPDAMPANQAVDLLRRYIAATTAVEDGRFA